MDEGEEALEVCVLPGVQINLDSAPTNFRHFLFL